MKVSRIHILGLYSVNFENIKPYLVIRFKVLFVYMEIMQREQWVRCMISNFDIDKEKVPSLYYTISMGGTLHNIDLGLDS